MVDEDCEMNEITITCRNCGEYVALPADAVLVVCKKCNAQYKISWKEGVLSATRIIGQPKFTADISRVNEAVKQSAFVSDLEQKTYKTEKNIEDTVVHFIPGIGCITVVLLLIIGGLSFRHLDDALLIMGFVVIVAMIIGGFVVNSKKKKLEAERKKRDEAIDRIKSE